MQKIATTYKHVQEEPSNVWTVTHNLGTYPITDVYVEYDGAIIKILPASTTYVNENVCTLEFTDSFSGFAVVI